MLYGGSPGASSGNEAVTICPLARSIRVMLGERTCRRKTVPVG